MGEQTQWITPEDIQNYTEIPGVRERAPDKLVVDIARAVQFVRSYTHNIFADGVPEQVKTAVMLLAEYYAQQAVESKNRLLKSEAFDDYSYTAADDTNIVRTLGLAALLDDYVVAKAKNGVSMSLRKL